MELGSPAKQLVQWVEDLCNQGRFNSERQDSRRRIERHKRVRGITLQAPSGPSSSNDSSLVSVSQNNRAISRNISSLTH